MEDFVERCDNCRWHRDVPEEFQEKVKEVQEKLLKKIEEEYRWQYDSGFNTALYGDAYVACVKKGSFVQTKFCCGSWEEPTSYFE